MTRMYLHVISHDRGHPAEMRPPRRPDCFRTRPLDPARPQRFRDPFLRIEQEGAGFGRLDH